MGKQAAGKLQAVDLGFRVVTRCLPCRIELPFERDLVSLACLYCMVGLGFGLLAWECSGPVVILVFFSASGVRWPPHESFPALRASGIRKNLLGFCEISLMDCCNLHRRSFHCRASICLMEGNLITRRG